MTIQQGPDDPARYAAGEDLALRAAKVAAIASAHAVAVDRDARFPAETVEALKSERLLGAGIPPAFGGEGATLGAQADIAYALGRSCASSAMIYAMHGTKIACLVRHGAGQPRIDGVLRRVASEQLLLASSTTEGQGGGNVRSSAAAIEPEGDQITLVREATVISYGAQADGIVTVARRAQDAGSGDQVLCVFLKDDYTLERLSGWDTFGMRGTCSSGFRLQVRSTPDQILQAPYGQIHGRTMTPVSHILWASAWAGIAASAVEKAQSFVRTAARGAGGQMPPGAPHQAKAAASLGQIRALIAAALDRFEGGEADPAQLEAFGTSTAFAMLKVEVSELAVATVNSALRATGLAGYRDDGPFTMGRHLRDILSSPIMIHNDRIVQNVATGALMAPVPATLRG